MKRSTVLYYCQLETGIILEDTDFRNVYNATRLELRNAFGHSLFFDCSTATIYEGILVEWTEEGRNKFTYVPLRPVVTMHCMSINRRTYFHVVRGTN